MFSFFFGYKVVWSGFNIFYMYSIAALTEFYVLQRSKFWSVPSDFVLNIQSKCFCCKCADMDLLTAEECHGQILPVGDTWSVHKFGGTCVGTADRIKNVASIIVDDISERKVAVVSAMSKVTDMMYDMLHRAEKRDDSYIEALDRVYQKHKETAVSLLQEGEDLSKFLSTLESDVQNLRAMLRAIFIGVWCKNSDL
jgi:hypothetical protein